MIEFVLNGGPVEVPDDVGSLLEALRERLGITSPKDGCSPQGQCGCCTVWVDGSARAACVTPAKRVQGRVVTTLEGLKGLDGLDDAESWAESFCAAGASQCGFCTPGIIMRIAALPAAARRDRDAIEKALIAHLCRCTGWNSIVDACVDVRPRSVTSKSRDHELASRRAELEGGVPQVVGAEAALGKGGFAEDSAPDDALVAMLDSEGEWVVRETNADVRMAAGKVPGRRSSAAITWPIDVPPGEWVRSLQTTWVEPAYLEPDATWCAPGGEPASVLANGGAFGGKHTDELGAVARRLADTHGRPVRVRLTREDVVRLGPKRPPIAGGVRGDGSGVIRVARPLSGAEQLISAISAAVPRIDVELIDLAGPPVSNLIRGAGWVEAAVLAGSIADGPARVVAPNGAVASASIDSIVAADGRPVEQVHVQVQCGDVLDEVVLRSYCVGATHMALGWVRSEGLAIGHGGVPLNLTIRSFGILRAVDMPQVDVEIVPDDGAPMNGSDAVFAAVAAAAWKATDYASRWPAQLNRNSPVAST